MTKNVFRCNICDSKIKMPLEELDREVISCKSCRSTPRFRSVISVLSSELFGRPLSMKDFPHRPDLRGIGFSDWHEYANRLARKFNYTNTFLDRDPILDISRPQPQLAGTCDFVIASEVFEHVIPPVERAFGYLLDILKPGGLFVLTVPFSLEPSTKEHFPSLAEFELAKFKDQHVLINRNHAGQLEIFENLVFHGGDGLVLEMRVFSKDELLSTLGSAGFVDARVMPGAEEFGAVWPEPWSLPIVARKPR